MKFDEQNKVLIDTLNPVEAKAFIDFLWEEKNRHKDCVVDAGRRAKLASTCVDEYWKARSKFWESELARHKDDILDIKALIEKVRGLFE